MLNSLFGNALSPFGGVRIIESLNMVTMTEDWSLVRSPSRAERRRRYGHKQNIRVIAVPKKEAITIDGGRTFIMHPEMAAAFRSKLQQERVKHRETK